MSRGSDEPVALLDFGDTLAIETYMRVDSAQFPRWTAEWLDVMRTARSAWDRGQMSADRLAEVLAARLSSDADDVRVYMRDLAWSGIYFLPKISAAVAARRNRGGRQALVTIKPTIFREVVDLYELTNIFDNVVISGEHGSADKVSLCRIALGGYGISDPSEGLLIDNRSANIKDWVAVGGQGHLFQGDDKFEDDVIMGTVPGFSRRDIRRVATLNRNPAENR